MVEPKGAAADFSRSATKRYTIYTKEDGLRAELLVKFSLQGSGGLSRIAPSTQSKAPAELKPYFEQYDVNKDGAIDLNETQALVKHANRGQDEAEPAPVPGRVTAKQLITLMDQNGDARISEEEAPEELKPNFRFIDTNGDGEIDVKEAEVMAKYANQQQGR